MSKSYFKNMISKFLSFFNRKRKKATSEINKINPDTEEESADDIYPLW